jgi:hypothetical protein
MDMDEHQLLHDRFMLDMYKDEYLKKPNPRYDYMHIQVQSEFIFGIFNIFKQHWNKPTPNRAT